jgi:Ca2+-binding RTX toxin-like protein
MTTGTEGNDNLTNDPAVRAETIDALGGNDIVTVGQPLKQDQYHASSDVQVLGGDGYDTLKVGGGVLRAVSLTDLGGTLMYRVSNSFNYSVSWSSIERLEISGSLFGTDPFVTTGSSVDILRLSTVYAHDITVETNGGDDEVYFSGGDVSGGGIISIATGAGNDIIDFTGVTSATGPFRKGDGGEGDDVLRGSAYSDTLIGGAGNDILDGGAGSDALAGGTGNDIYYEDTFGDNLYENPGEGEADEVRTPLGSATNHNEIYVLPDNIENLTGTATGGQGIGANTADNVITMGAGNDLVVAEQGGNDTVAAGAGNDFVYYGGAWSAADKTDGGAGSDTVGLLGNYTVTLAADTLVDVERLALYTGLSSPGGSASHYNLTTVDATVAAGAVLRVTATSLAASETLIFNGSAESDGRFTVLSGAGNDIVSGGQMADRIVGGAGDDQLYGLGGQDTLLGGLGADVLRGGFGRDIYRYESVAESTAGSVDRIVDFSAGGEADRIDLAALDADGRLDGNQSFRFIGVNAGFSESAGELRAVQTGNRWFIEGDVNGDGVADLIIEVTKAPGHIFSAGDFVL